MNGAIRRLTTLDDDQLMTEAKVLGAPYDPGALRGEGGRAAGAAVRGGRRGDAGGRGALHAPSARSPVFVGSGIFLSESPARRARAVVEAVTHFEDPARLAAISDGLGEAMRGTESAALEGEARLARRGWLMRVGVLALQGAFARHAEVLSALGHEVVEVRGGRATSRGSRGWCCPAARARRSSGSWTARCARRSGRSSPPARRCSRPAPA